MDTTLLVKCLALTQSNNDSEALAAVRKANLIRDKLGVTWDQLFDDDAPTANDYSSYNEYAYGSQATYNNQPEDFDDCFESIYSHNPPTGKWEEIIGSIRSQWEMHGSLSDKQAALIRKFHKTAETKYGRWRATQENEPVDEW